MRGSRGVLHSRGVSPPLPAEPPHPPADGCLVNSFPRGDLLEPERRGLDEHAHGGDSAGRIRTPSSGGAAECAGLRRVWSGRDRMHR